MATYYHVRISEPSGKLLHGSTWKGLSKAVRALESDTGQPWPYQVIHRALGAGPLWASACGARLVSIEDAGDTPGPASSWWLQNAQPRPRISEDDLPGPLDVLELDRLRALIDRRLGMSGLSAPAPVAVAPSRPADPATVGMQPLFGAAGDCAPCVQCKTVHQRVPGNWGLCPTCMDELEANIAPEPAEIITNDKDFRCAGNFHKLPCARLSKWQAKQYGCTCPPRGAK